jgi:hypothetical protein
VSPNKITGLYNVILHYCRGFRVYKFQTKKHKTKLLMECGKVTEKFYLATLYSPHWFLGENMTSYLKMTTVREKAMCVVWFFERKPVIKMQRRYRTQYWKVSPSDNAIRRWFMQFQETGSVLHRKGAGRPRNSQEDVDRIHEAFSRSPQKSTKRTSLQLGIPQTTVWRVFHNRIHLHITKCRLCGL